MMDVIPLDTGDRVPSGNLNLSELKTKLQETYVKIVEDDSDNEDAKGQVKKAIGEKIRSKLVKKVLVLAAILELLLKFGHLGLPAGHAS